MSPFFTLPRSLLALLLASPALALTLISPNDPLRSIALLAPKPQDSPVCCLATPPPPQEPIEDENVLLSFEEWKVKQFANAKANARPSSIRNATPPDGAGSGNDSLSPVEEGSSITHPDGSTQTSGDHLGSGSTSLVSPHFRVPLTDRFNYASLDCSARVHTAHRAAKSAHSILSSKKDKYMLSPCAGDRQYVVVELCEDIRIDTVQLANFEFFSGVFKDFRVSVAKTYTMDAEGWTVAGSYRAKNVRGVQVCPL